MKNNRALIQLVKNSDFAVIKNVLKIIMII